MGGIGDIGGIGWCLASRLLLQDLLGLRKTRVAEVAAKGGARLYNKDDRSQTIGGSGVAYKPRVDSGTPEVPRVDVGEVHTGADRTLNTVPPSKVESAILECGVVAI